MVHLVVGWRVENPLQRTKPADQIGVQPELVEQIDGSMNPTAAGFNPIQYSGRSNSQLPDRISVTPSRNALAQ